MEAQPYDRIEVRDDGYLWLVNFRPQEGETAKEDVQQPLLLHSTAALLVQLEENNSKGLMDATNANDKEDETKTEEPIAEEEEEGKESDTPEKAAVANDNNKNDDKKKNAKPTTTTPPPKVIDNTTYKHLTRADNLGDRIISALVHIRQFKHDGRKRQKRGDRDDRRETKVKALQHQRSRLQKQKEQQKLLDDQEQQQLEKGSAGKDGANTATALEEHQNNIENMDVDDADFLVVKNKDDGDENESVASAEAEQIQQHPYVRLVRTFNSIRALAPILRAMIFHSDRNNKDIRVGRKGVKIVDGKRKAACWLLGRRVFDVVNVSPCQTMAVHLEELLALFLPATIATAIIDGTLTNEQEFWSKQWLEKVWVSPDPVPSIRLASPTKILQEYALELDKDDNAEKSTTTAAATTQQRIKAIATICKTIDERFFSSTKAMANITDPDQKKVAAEQMQYDQAVTKLHLRLANLLEKDFPDARLSVYGSCLSNLSLKASDVDLSLFLPQADKIKKSFANGTWSPSRYEKEMSKLVRDVWKKLMYRRKEYADMVPVTRARVPVVKGCYLLANNPHTQDGSLHFDICFLNDIAVANSSLLREYSLMDDAIRELMIVVKKWAKDNKVCAAQDNTLSSYAWMCMVVFYLQCIEYVPNLQCPKLMQKVGLRRDQKEYWHNVNDLDTCYLTWEKVQTVWKRPAVFDEQPLSCTALLYGFFHFYAKDFTRSISMISIKRGREEVLPKTTFRKCSSFYCIEDPFETFDSHAPHDLGIPVSDVQCERIVGLLELGEEHLRALLLDCGNYNEDHNTDIVGTMRLWPSIEVSETGAKGGGNNKSKKTKGKNRNNNGGRRGGPAPDQKQNQAKNGGDNKGSPKKTTQTKGAPKGGLNKSNSQAKKGGANNPSKANAQATQPSGQETKGPKSGQNKGKQGGAENSVNTNTSQNGRGKGSGGRGRGGGGGRGGGSGRGRGSRNRGKGQEKQPADRNN